MKQRLISIDGIRTICNLLIVFVHLNAVELSASANSYDAGIVSFICNKFAWSAMPVLFMLSGYLMLRGYTFEGWKSNIRRRLLSLLLPYVVWNLTYVIILQFWSYLDIGQTVWPTYKAVLKILGFATQPADTPLWYIRSLIGWLIITPVLSYALCERRRMMITLACVGVFVMLLSWVGLGCRLRIVFPLYSILAFLFGAVLSVLSVDVDKHFYRYRVLYAAIGLLCYILSPHIIFSEIVIFLRGFFLLGVFGMMISFVKRCANSRLWNYLVAASFFIYASHRIVCWKMVDIWRYVSSFESVMQLPFGGISLMVFECLGTIAISLLLYKIVNVCLPFLGKVLSRH